MTHDQHELYRRILSFELDEPNAQLPLSLRLARKNGWTVAFARRVIDEYKRFAFLAVAAGHAVCPSHDVDEAWHLHLTYTRSYWRQFCPNVLGMPLHHQPTQGGPAELAKHVAMYEQTLASYRKLIAAEPPADIWPGAHERFRPGRAQRVDLDQHWVIPKPRLANWLTAAVGGATPLAAVAYNPFDLDGPSFLVLYAFLLPLAIFAAWLLRRLLCSTGEGELPPPELLPLEAAYLAGGRRVATTAAIAGLVQSQSLTVEQTEKKFLGMKLANGEYRLAARDALPPDATPLERSLHAAAGTQGESLANLHEATRHEADQLATRLEQHGLVLSRGDARRAAWWPASIVFLVFLVGLIKIGVGISRDKPVGFLIGACIVTSVATAFFLLRRAMRTTAGDTLLADLKVRHAALKSSAGVASAPL
ncbi:MAG TPA: TIGR04222 domain-containing membrane protein, partial [Pirellulales bacterium]|nr:TIGR04222 domain-containing membrane protein [Pirellulales bacterium]